MQPPGEERVVMSGENYFLLQSSRCSKISESATSASRMLAYRALRREYDEQAIIARLMSLPAKIDRIGEFKHKRFIKFHTVRAKKITDVLENSMIEKSIVDIFENGIFRELVLRRIARPKA